jgi:transposase
VLAQGVEPDDGRTNHCGSYLWESSKPFMLMPKSATTQLSQQVEVNIQATTIQANAGCTHQQRRVGRQVISQELKERVVQYLQSTPQATISEAARIFGMAVSTATSIVRRHEERGTSAPRARGGARTPKMTTSTMETMDAWVNDRPDITLRELKYKLAGDLGISVTEKTVSRALTKIGYTVKILRVIPLSRNCPETIQARLEYAQRYLGDAPPDHKNIVWVDECGFNLHLRRRFGRARRGDRASVTVANGRGRNISVCAAMSEEGFLHERLRPGAYNTDEFCIFLFELFEFLAHIGRTRCWIILDNVRFHHSQAVVACAAQYEHRLIFLPPYSPMLNPIESLFGKWKTLIRMQDVAFSQNELLVRMASARGEISVTDCLGWIRDMDRNIGLSLLGHIFE